ncbi:MAG: hypothetical protein ACLFRI_04595 [Candidatus Izemoplasmataceae bacterium]
MKKKLLGLFLLLFLIGGSGVAFAIWDDLEEVDTVTVGIGEGTTLAVNLDTQTSGTLVPNGVLLKSGDVESVVIEYTVELDQTVIAPLDFTVNASNVEIGGDTTYANLVNILIVADSTLGNTAGTVTVTVTLTEPSTTAEYDAIINEEITFDLTFTATDPA